ncbi:hypothetical protein Dimus_003547 [Dionaea muscipula]
MDEGLFPRDRDILLETDPKRLRAAMTGLILYRHLDKLFQSVEEMQGKELQWKMLEKRFEEMEMERDKREIDIQQRAAELKESSNWGQKLHRENGELLKQADAHRTTISQLSVEVEEEKRKREKAEERIRNFRKWEKEVKEEEKKKRKMLHDEIATMKKNQEIGRSATQKLQDDIENLQKRS